MAAVDRADYMDNIKVAEIEQTIQKEKATQRQFLTEQVAQGKIALRPPTPPQPRVPLSQRFGVPPHLAGIRADPDAEARLTISRSLWGSCNSGYIVRDSARLTSTMKADFVWNEEELDFMKQQRLLDKTHNRRRDEHTRYVESKALYDAMMKGRAA